MSSQLTATISDGYIRVPIFDENGCRQTSQQITKSVMKINAEINGSNRVLINSYNYSCSLTESRRKKVKEFRCAGSTRAISTRDRLRAQLAQKKITK